MIPHVYFDVRPCDNPTLEQVCGAVSNLAGRLGCRVRSVFDGIEIEATGSESGADLVTAWREMAFLSSKVERHAHAGPSQCPYGHSASSASTDLGACLG